MNLSSEIIVSLALTGLMGLWLIWQAMKINSNIDILKISINWFRDRPIILPSLLFLISPFLFTYISQTLLKLSDTSANNAISDKVLEKILLVFATTTSFLIGNRFLEGFKKNQEEKKISKMLIASMEGHLENLEEIIKYLDVSDLRIKEIDKKIDKIKNDYVYKSALEKIGILESKYIDIIARYSRSLNSVIDSIPRVYNTENKEKFINSYFVELNIKEIVIKPEMLNLVIKLYI
jgi:hypothetical protein